MTKFMDKSLQVRALRAEEHTPVYTMHKYFARRPWNVFSHLVSQYTQENDVVLDPMCGGGVTVVESLRLRRRVIGIDLNPLATYVTEMEVRPIDISRFWKAFQLIKEKVGAEIQNCYRTQCTHCKNKNAVADWIERSAEGILRLKYACPRCSLTAEKIADMNDLELAKRLDKQFEIRAQKRKVWFPKVRIPIGDKTDSLLKQGYHFFFELFTKRNLLALGLLRQHILRVRNRDVRDFLYLAFSSSLKWASKQSHLRGDIVEGWAMHAYWIYPKWLEINVWNTFERRCRAVARGKEYSNSTIGRFYRKAKNFGELRQGATCLILTRSSTNLPIDSESVDAVITDPPYGGNVNYGELADFWIIWHRPSIIDKKKEIIVNKSQKKSLADYQDLMYLVLRECHRVLKPDGKMIVTFNSKDLRVVASFIIAAARSGFMLDVDSLTYQPPIRAYTTTFHAMQIGAFTGDFIFIFYKSIPEIGALRTETYVEFKKQINLLTENDDKLTEPQIRERAYKLLIPFLARQALSNLEACDEAVRYFEGRMEELEAMFKKVRKEITEERRQYYLRMKNPIDKDRTH